MKSVWDGCPELNASSVNMGGNRKIIQQQPHLATIQISKEAWELKVTEPSPSWSTARVATHSGKQGKRKMVKKIPCREKSGNLKFC